MRLLSTRSWTLFLGGCATFALAASPTLAHDDPDSHHGHPHSHGDDRHERYREYEAPDSDRKHDRKAKHPRLKEPGPDYARTGGYVGFSALFAEEAYRDQDLLGRGTDVGDSFGWSTRLGARVHPHLAGELQYEWIEGFDLQQFRGDPSEVRSWALTSNLKLFLLKGAFQPYVMAGAGIERAWTRDVKGPGVEFDEIEFVGRAGGGVDLYLNEWLALNFEASYVAPTGPLDDLDRVSIGWGLNVRF